MVFIFGIDIPLIELMLFSIAFFVVVLFLAIVSLLWANRREYKMIKETENIINVEHRHHGAKNPAVKYVKKSPSIFKQWGNYWNQKKDEAKRTWQQRYNTEVKESLTPIEAPPKPHNIEHWWDMHKKEVEKREKEERITSEKKSIERGSWVAWHKIQIQRQGLKEEKEKARAEHARKLREAVENKKREAEMRKTKANSWWEMHKREVARRPNPKNKFDVFWRQQKKFAQGSLIPKEEEPRKSIFAVWNRYWNKQKKAAKTRRKK
ncbi:MAG: hypothetical protein PHC66_05190 [Candidatus Nanoarchaeia archaeon]|nr:hypothetical protein [Candidatus Nanoarchaeia archaeon]MDD5239420.1 hypothetical protein [Candidatus Nanoarchaeia archaeon]